MSVRWGGRGPGHVSRWSRGSSFDPASLFAGAKKGALFTPWLSGSLWQDSGGGATTPAAVGDPVGKIIDWSGNGNHAVAANNGARAKRYSNQGATEVLGNGTTSNLLTPNIDLSGVDTVTVILSAVAGMAARMAVEFGHSFSDTGSFYLEPSINHYDANLGGSGFRVRQLSDYPPITREIVAVLFKRSDTSSPTISINGVDGGGTLSTGTTVTGNFNSARPISLLARWNGSAVSLPSDMGLSGLLVIEGQLSAADIANTSAYFSAHTQSNGSTSDCYALGDSTVGVHTSGSALLRMVETARQRLNVAHAGDTINDQLTKWNALTINKSRVGWVIIQIGLNDLSYSETAATALARLQTLVSKVRTDVGTAPVLIAQMDPCKQRLIDLYGATNGATSYQKWLDMNDAIAGNGANAITGVDGRITAHVAQLNDGSGNLAAAYDSGDHIHPTNAGRLIVATEWVNALNGLSITP